MSSGGGGWPPSDADGFGQGGRYDGDEYGTDRDQGRYQDESGYEWSEPSSRSRNQPDPHSRGRTDQYGQDVSRPAGRHSASPSYGESYGQDGYGQGGYRQDPYGDGYGQGWQPGSRYGDDQHSPGGYEHGGYEHGGYSQGGYEHGGYDQGGHDQGGPGQGSYGPGGFGSYTDPGYGRDGYGRDPGPDRYSRGSYGQDGYGQDGYAQGGYGQPGYGGDYYGQSTAGRALPAPDGLSGDGYQQDGPSTEAYGRDQYGHDGYGTTGSYQAPGGYQQPDGYAQDNGYFSRPSDTGSSGGADTGSFGRPDTGSFGRADTGSFGVSGSATSRIGEANTPFGAGQDTVGAGGYDQWHEAADDGDGWDSDDGPEHDGDWQDDADGGLLSRRFSADDGGRGGGRGPRRRAGRPKRPKRLRGRFAFTAAILAGALVLGAVADFGYERFEAWHKSRYGDYPGPGTGLVRFTVGQGAVLSTLGPALVKAGVVEEVRPFTNAANAAPNASHLQPGVYLLHKHMSSALAVTYLLSSAHRVNDEVTIIEGTRASAIAQLLATKTGKPVSQFTQIIDHPPASLGLPSWAAGKTAEGFLFPDTYAVLPSMTPLHILQMMVTEFKQKVAGINLVGSAHKVFTTPWHALIVASMIQAEAGSDSDFGKISRVVWNRLLAKMPLEFDSTVFYAMGKYGTAVNAQQRNFPSPYNTYLHTGLPPGPIGNPGVLAMQAAVHATKGQWLYFLTDTKRKPYKTYFYDTLAQLQAAQRKYGV